MKELDLQIFEKHPDADAYRFGPSFTPYAIVGVDKRFTDAELAAEYWSEANAPSLPYQYEASMRRLTLYHFATRPHFDEQ